MDLEQQLRAALAPCRPSSALRAAVLARVSAPAMSARDTQRAPRRLILGGVALAIAAAAALLGTRLTGTRGDLPAVGTPPAIAAMEPAAVTAETLPSAPVPAPVAVEPAAVTVRDESRPAVAAIKPFVVRMKALQNDATDPASRAAVDAFNAAFLEDLRAVPGLKLQVVDAAAGRSSDYQLTIRGTGSPAENKYTIDLRATAPGGPVQPIKLSGEIAPACAGAPGCGDTTSMAATLVEWLRTNYLPDPSRPLELRTKLLDASLTSQQRVAALTALEALHADGTRDPAGTGSGAKELLRDPAIVRVAVGIATAADDPVLRAQVWRSMRGVRTAELVQPLIAALAQDPDNKVRVEAVTNLAADFADDPRVRGALDAATRDDSRPIRVLAQRGLAGEAAWNTQILTALKDSSLPALERIEPLFYTLTQGGRPQDPHELLADEAAIRAFAQVLPRAAASTQADQRLLPALLSRVGSIDHPAITELLLGTLASSRDAAVRRTVLNQLAGRTADARVRSALEKTSAEDTDPRLRELALRALKTAADAAATP